MRGSTVVCLVNINIVTSSHDNAYFVILPVDPPTAGECDCGDHRVQVSAVSVLCALQRVDAAEDSTRRGPAAAANLQERPPSPNRDDGGA